MLPPAQASCSAQIAVWHSLAHGQLCLGAEVLAVNESQIDAEAWSGVGESS
jgi:hypothetical protein